MLAYHQATEMVNTIVRSTLKRFTENRKHVDKYAFLKSVGTQVLDFVNNPPVDSNEMLEEIGKRFATKEDYTLFNDTIIRRNFPVDDEDVTCFCGVCGQKYYQHAAWDNNYNNHFK